MDTTSSLMDAAGIDRSGYMPSGETGQFNGLEAQRAPDPGRAEAAAEPFDGYVESVGAAIHGGTPEIQRSMIAERVPGLPKGP